MLCFIGVLGWWMFRLQMVFSVIRLRVLVALFSCSECTGEPPAHCISTPGPRSVDDLDPWVICNGPRGSAFPLLVLLVSA